MQDKKDTFDSNKGFRLGPWTYRPDSGALQARGQVKRLSDQLNQVLALLIARQPEVVTRQQFLDEVWKNKVVNEDALSRTIAELRKTLGDSASQSKYIKTIPKKGYQFVHQVEPVQLKKKRSYQIFVLLLSVSLMGFMLFWFYSRVTILDTLKQAVTNASRVTSQPGLEKQSQLSTNGEWLVYVKDGSAGSQIIIESLLDPNRKTVVTIPGLVFSSPVLLPAQNQLVFVARDAAKCELKSYDLSSAQITNLSDCYFNPESRTLSWDETTNTVYFSHFNDQGKVAIFKLELSNGSVHQVTEPKSVNQQDWSPQISPDHKWLSFSRGNHAVRNIWLRDLQNGIEQPLTTGQHYSVSHAWYDPSHLVFDSDQSGSRQLWLININDARPELLGAYGAQHPSFDVDRNIMAFQEVSYEANIWLYETEGKQMTRLVHSTKYDNYPVFSADGRQFLFSSNRQDLSSIWLFDMELKKEQMLLSIPDAKLTRPSWSDDGQKILITVNDRHGYGTLELDLMTGEIEKINFGQAHMAAVEYLGGYLALAKSEHSQHQILHLDQQGVNVLPIKSVSRFMPLADGRLVLSKTDEDGLYLFDINTQQETLLTAAMKKNALNLWTAVNQSVYFDRGGTHAGLWKFDTVSGEMVLVTKYRPFSVGTSLSVNATENQVLMTRTDRAESDILKTRLK